MAYRILARFWPSGDYSIFREPRPRARGFQRTLLAVSGGDEQLFVSSEGPDSNMGLSLPVISHKAPCVDTSEVQNTVPGAVAGTSSTFKECSSVPPEWLSEAGPGDGLEQSDPSIPPVATRPPRTRLPRGSLGLSSYGAKMLRSACALLEARARGAAVGMVTLTIPWEDYEMVSTCTRLWPRIMNRFTQELSREMARVGLPRGWAFCNEWQRRGALHAHLVFQSHSHLSNPRGDEYPISKEWFRATWSKVLFNVVGVHHSCRSATRVEKVKKSLVGYMSKYISKGARVHPRVHRSMAIKENSLSGPVSPGSNTYSLSDTSIPESNGIKGDTKKQPSASTACMPDNPFPPAWYGMPNWFKQRILAKVLVLGKKVQDNPKYLGAHDDSWILEAECVARQLGSYYSRVVKAASGVVLSLAGRMRIAGGWRSIAMRVFFGRDLSDDAFYADPRYIRWRENRDGNWIGSDKVANEEWRMIRFRESVSYGI